MVPSPAFSALKRHCFIALVDIAAHILHHRSTQIFFIMSSGLKLQDVDSVLPVYSHGRSEIKSNFQLEKDDETLARLGKKQVLKVSFKIFNIGPFF